MQELARLVPKERSGTLAFMQELASGTLAFMQELARLLIKVALTAGQMINLIPMLAKRCKVVPLSSDELVYKCAICMKKINQTHSAYTHTLTHCHIHAHT